MTGKDKRQQKKFDKLVADFKATTPQAGPARSPAAGPVRLNRLQAPFEALPGPVLLRVAAFAAAASSAGGAAVAHKDAQKTIAAISRSTFVAVEAVRHRSGAAADLDGVVRAVAAKRAALAGPGSSPASPVDSATGAVTLAAVAASSDADLIARVAFALLRVGRSALHNVRRCDATPAAADWVVAVVTNGKMPLATHDATTGSGRTLLHLVCALGDQPLAQRLINAAAASPHGFDAFVLDARRRTALHVAAAEGLSDTCLRIIHNADPTRAAQLATIADDAKRTVVDCATHGRHSKLAASLRNALQAILAADDEDDGDDGDYDDGDDY